MVISSVGGSSNSNFSNDTKIKLDDIEKRIKELLKLIRMHPIEGAKNSNFEEFINDSNNLDEVIKLDKQIKNVINLYREYSK